MSRRQHAARLIVLMTLAAAVLGTVASRTAVLFADGLRYIQQARLIDSGDLEAGLLGAVDHPVYPAAIALAHQARGGSAPTDWQAAAQAASITAGVLLMVPVYLVALELYGAGAAWMACVIVLFVPVFPRVFADALSESTFLCAWMWGIWFALRFLNAGRTGWLAGVILASVAAFLTRPEGLLLPLALAVSLLLLPCWRVLRLERRRYLAALVILVIGPAVVVGPFVVSKGNLSSKPAVQRLLGRAPVAPALAVERQRPLEEGTSRVMVLLTAGREATSAVREAITIPLLPLVVLAIGRQVRGRDPARRRASLFLALVAAGAMAGLIGLHATGGYCTPRHTLLLCLLLVIAAAGGLDGILQLRVPARWLGLGQGRVAAGPGVSLLLLATLAITSAPRVFEPLNGPVVGYREAAAWLQESAQPDAWVVDPTGWSLFYSGKQGYTFATLIHAGGDPNARYVVVRDAHLRGPWFYCDWLRQMVAGREPVARFPAQPRRGDAKVLIFDRQDDAPTLAGTHAGRH